MALSYHPHQKRTIAAVQQGLTHTGPSHSVHHRFSSRRQSNFNERPSNSAGSGTSKPLTQLTPAICLTPYTSLTPAVSLTSAVYLTVATSLTLVVYLTPLVSLTPATTPPASITPIVCLTPATSLTPAAKPEYAYLVRVFLASSATSSHSRAIYSDKFSIV